MAAYKTHVSFNMLLGYPLGAFLFYEYYSSAHPLFALFSGSYLMGTLFLNPDLDIANTFRIFSVRGILTLPFRPYGYLFSHRGISHWPVIGTVTRLMYIAALGGTRLLAVTGQIPSQEMCLYLYKQYTAPFWIVVVGLIYADICHLVLDGKRHAS